MTETTDAPTTGKRRATFNTLEVSELRRLTEDSVEVTFAVPEELADDYDYVPGQYVALRKELDGAEVRAEEVDWDDGTAYRYAVPEEVADAAMVEGDATRVHSFTWTTTASCWTTPGRSTTGVSSWNRTSSRLPTCSASPTSTSAPTWLNRSRGGWASLKAATGSTPSPSSPPSLKDRSRTRTPTRPTTRTGFHPGYFSTAGATG